MCNAPTIDACTTGDQTVASQLLVALGAAPATGVHVPGNPLPWARAGSAGAQRYTPPRLRAAKTAATRHLVKLAPAGPLDGNLALVALFFRDTRRRVDVDNLLKLVLDAGTDAGLWHDDSQITATAATISLDRLMPRTFVTLASCASTLDRTARKPARQIGATK